MRIDAHEFTCKYSSGIDVWCIRFEAFIVSENLRCGCCWHWSKKQRVSHALLHDLCSQIIPIISSSNWSYSPKVKLELSLTHWWSTKSSVRSFFESNFIAHFASSMVHCFEDHFVNKISLISFERNPHHLESISKSLNSDSNWSVSLVWVLSFRNWIIVLIDDSVEVVSYYLCDLMKFFIIKSSVFLNKSWKWNWGEVANSDFIFWSEFHDFTAEIWALDCSKILLIWFLVGMIFIEHVGISSFNLSINDMRPQMLGFDSWSSFAFLFILSVESFKLLSKWFKQARAFIRTHECPISFFLNSLHKEIRDPKSIEQISRSILLLTSILLHIQEIINISMPGLKVNGKRSFSLSASLIYVSSGIIKHLDHRHKSIGMPIRSSDIRLSRSDAMNTQPNTTSILRNDRSLLQSIKDSLNRVLPHRKQETRAHLGFWGSWVEQSRGCMCEPLVTHQVIRKNCSFRVLTMNTNTDSHKHGLRSFSNLASEFQEVRFFKGFESEVVVVQVSFVIDGCFVLVFVLHYKVE